jgi:hypothetical protein
VRDYLAGLTNAAVPKRGRFGVVEERRLVGTITDARSAVAQEFGSVETGTYWGTHSQAHADGFKKKLMSAVYNFVQ